MLKIPWLLTAMVVLYSNTNKRVTLFDRYRDNSLYGTIYFSKSQPLSNLIFLKAKEIYFLNQKIASLKFRDIFKIGTSHSLTEFLDKYSFPADN